MRLKHVKGAEEKVIKSPYVIKDIKKGEFNKYFKNNNPIHLEIGMGKGDFIIEKAKQNPNINFIGLEKQASVLIRALEKQEVLKLENLYFLNKDAKDINEIFEKEIDTLYLNFSDPWPKERHAKRRLTSDVFLEKYETIFKDTKHIEMKTDNKRLFEYSIKTLTNNNYKIIDIRLNLHEDDIDNIETEYERKFSSKGFPIYKIEVSK